MRFHIIKTLYNPTYKILDLTKHTNLDHQNNYLVDQETGMVTPVIESSDEYVELVNTLIELRMEQKIENYLKEVGRCLLK